MSIESRIRLALATFGYKVYPDTYETGPDAMEITCEKVV
jgi:hypothetical protein